MLGAYDGLLRNPSANLLLRIDRRYVRNLEERKGRPARLVLGDPMLDEIDVLPTPQALSDAVLHRCSVDAGDARPSQESIIPVEGDERNFSDNQRSSGGRSSCVPPLRPRSTNLT